MAKDFAAIDAAYAEAGIWGTEANSKDVLVSKFVKAWENQTARRAVKGATGLTMALTLAACGGSDDTTVVTPATKAVDTTPPAVDPTPAPPPVVDPTPVVTESLTANTDNIVGTAENELFDAPLVFTPGGTDRINSLQDEDVIDGGGGRDTLRITLGNTNDNGFVIITPSISNVEVIDVAFTAQEALSLDLQDTDMMLDTVNVTRINMPEANDVYDTAVFGQASTVVNMPETAVDLSISNTVFYSDHAFGYRDDEIGDVEQIAVSLDRVNLETLYIGSTNNVTNHINDFNFTVSAASHIETLNIGQGSAEAANQTISIDAQANFVLAADVDGDGDYLNDNQALAEFEDHLESVTITGSGNVTLGAVGVLDGFTLEGSASTGNIHVNINNSVDDETASFTTGTGNDRVTAMDVGIAANFMAADLVTNAGNDSVELDDTEMHDTASISTGAGADTVAVEMMHGTVAGGASIDTGSNDDTVSFTWQAALWDNTPTVDNLGENGFIEAVVEEEAVVSTGSGNDAVIFNISDDTPLLLVPTVLEVPVGPEVLASAVQVVIEGDSTLSDAADDLGGKVDLGAGDDRISFSFLGQGLGDQLSGTSVIEGNVDGGAGNDVMSFIGNKVIVVVDSNTSNTPSPAGKYVDVFGDEDVAGLGVEGIETLNLTSVAGYDVFRAAEDGNDPTKVPGEINGFSDEPDVGSGDSLPDIVSVNDDNGQTADYYVDLNEFDADLATVNIRHLDGVVDNKNVEDTYQNAFDGDAAEYHLAGIVDEKINVVGFETTAVENVFNYDNIVDASASVTTFGNADDDRAVLDPFGNIYDAGTFSADVILAVSADNAGATLSLDLQDATPLDISAAGVENYDVKIVSDAISNVANNGWAEDHDFASLNLAISSNDQLSIDLSNDFETALTVTGDAGETGGWANIINVNAAAIDTSGYEGRVYIGYEGTAPSHIVTAGNNDDVVRLGDDGQIATVNVTSTVAMGLGDDVLVMNFAGATVGLGATDSLNGNAGDDVLAFGGTGAELLMRAGYADIAPEDKVGEANRVRHDESEYDDVYNFETFWYGVGTGNNPLIVHDVVDGLSGATPDDTSKYYDADEYGNPAVYPAGGSVANGVERFVTDLHQDTNEDTRYIINDENNAAGYDVELSNDIIARNASLDVRYAANGVQPFYLLNIVNDDHGAVDADFALDVMELNRYHNVNFQGADQHDRVIFTDGSLDGRDVLIGGGNTSDELILKSSFSGDTIEVRNDASITANDLQGISGFEILELSSDQAVDQTFTVTLDDTVDASLDYIFLVGGGEAVYSAGSTFGEVAGAGSVILDLDAASFSSGLTVNAEFSGDAGHVIVTGSGVDKITGGDGADRIEANGGNDVIDGGAGADVIVNHDIANNGTDTVTFDTGADKFELSSADLQGVTGFTAYTGGGTKIDIDTGVGTMFVEFVSAVDADADPSGAGAALIYNETDGTLSFDADGTGAQAAVVFADLGAGAPGDILFTDFSIVA